MRVWMDKGCPLELEMMDQVIFICHIYKEAHSKDCVTLSVANTLDKSIGRPHSNKHVYLFQYVQSKQI